MFIPSLLLRAIIECLFCIMTICLNILFIVAIIRLRTLRTPQNILLVNSALNLICSCFTFLTSVTIALQYSITHYINMELCRIIGYLIYSFCHGIMYSYLLVSINRFLHTFYCLQKYYLSIKFLIFEIILQWFLSFLIPLIPLFLNQIEFQIKPRFCSPRKPFYMTLEIMTGFFLPIIFMTVSNLIIYFHINKLHTDIHLSFQQKQKYKLNKFYQISHRLYNRQNNKNVKLLHQFAAFSCVFVIGWGFFACISIFDLNDIVPESIYLITLSFPAISLFIITLMIINWNKPIKQSIFTLFNSTSRKHSTSATTVQFSAPLGFNCN
ncbi:unnamed protein product [Rotaria sordida]|uniref:G-protein coupled receptors family 1 profile domain-containing protein n=1 Tax=Rotaria sordida TaxID=392033 RepID=A0A814HBU3_9BILA|nr:unnamed protein product [Rotaria sordida]CAF1150263.1 unnamed protein product [Rotaria sordida]CAF3498288.1 unnamed protein product [Rotaria sordida]CAF3572405.1 unnamed protein product [Rotaria sordida]